MTTEKLKSIRIICLTITVAALLGIVIVLIMR